MSKSKLTLLIDGNWLLMSRLSVLNKNYIDDYELCQELKLLMIKSINVVLRTFPLIDNIIFCSDGGSWRNKIEIPKCLDYEHNKELVEYKGTRVKSDDINWDVIFMAYEDLMTTLSSVGITISKENNIEGDDWMFHWSKFLNEHETNCIIWTKDNDLKQLINIDKNKCFTVWWEKNSGLFVSDNMNEDDFNFMFNYEFTNNEQLLNHIIEKASKVTKINPKNIVIEKILKGDSSDNIFPIILRKSKTNSEKKFKISAKDINYDLNYNNDDEVKNYIHQIINQKNYIGRVEHTEEEIIEHFKYNRTLIALEEKNYPKEILDKMNEYNNYNISKNVYLAESQIRAESNKLNGILNII